MSKKGKITQIIGAVVDVNFETDLPEIYTALEVNNSESKLISVNGSKGYSDVIHFSPLIELSKISASIAKFKSTLLNSINFFSTLNLKWYFEVEKIKISNNGMIIIFFS